MLEKGWDLSSAKWILALSLTFAAALNGTMVMPLIVMAAGRLPGFDEGLATAVVASEIAGVALYCLLLPRFGTRSPRRLALAAAVLLAASEAGSGFLADPAPLAAARFAAGLAEGALFSLIARQLAARAGAERIWGQINLIGGLAMGSLLYGLSNLPDGRDIFLWLAAFTAVAAPAILLAGAPDNAPAGDAGPRPGRIGLILGIVFLVYAVQAGQWAVSGYVGETSSLSAARVGLYLALSSIAGFIGAAVPSLTRNPGRRLPGVLVGFLVMSLALAFFFNLAGAVSFLGAQILVNVGFYMATPFLTGLLTEADRDGALLMKTLVVALSGAAIGTAVAGETFIRLGPVWFSVAAIAAVAFGAAGATRIFTRGVET